MQHVLELRMCPHQSKMWAAIACLPVNIIVGHMMFSLAQCHPGPQLLNVFFILSVSYFPYIGKTLHLKGESLRQHWVGEGVMWMPLSLMRRQACMNPHFVLLWTRPKALKPKLALLHCS